MTEKVEYKRRVQPKIPKNLEEANHFLLLISYAKWEIEQILAKLNGAVEEQARIEIDAKEERIAQFVEGIYVFAESHREELTKGGEKKTIELPAGIMAWRNTPPRDEINKEVMPQEPEMVEGVESVIVDQHEEFYVQFSGIDIQFVSFVSKLKRAV